MENELRDVARLRATLTETLRERGAGDCCSHPKAIADLFEHLTFEVFEEVHVAGVNNANRTTFTAKVAMGAAGNCPVSMAQILRPVLIDGAPGLILVHNHPSGDPTASTEDVLLTHRLARACDLLGLRLVDHIIVGRDGHTSLKEIGVLA